MKNSIHFLCAVFFALLLCSNIFAQNSIGVISGTIHDKRSEIEKEVTITLVEITTHTKIQEITPDRSGTFTFRNVPFATYDVNVIFDSILLARKRVDVRSNIPIVLSIDSLREYELAGVSIVATQNQTNYGTHTIFTATSLENLPKSSQTKGIESLLLNSPGVVPDEDGRLHVRGEDAQLQYVVDGIPITQNMTRIYSGLFNSGLIKSADFMTGGLNAEYGVAASGILAITTKSGFESPFFVNASGNIGSFGNKESSLEIGGNVHASTAYYFTGGVSSSNRYLDPVSGFDPIHDDGNSKNFFGKINTILSNSMDLTILGSANSTDFSIPNLTDANKQDQKQSINDNMLGVRLNVVIGENSMLSILGYRRYAEAELKSGGMSDITDTKKALSVIDDRFIGALRKNTVTGGDLEYSMKPTWFGLENDAKVGFGGESFPLEESFAYADTASLQSGKYFSTTQSRTGNRLSGYFQDQAHWNKWTFSAGIRFDQFQLFDTEQALSPRLVVAYLMSDNLVLRFSYNRIVMQSPIENILISSSADAAAYFHTTDQGTVPTQVRSEKSHNVEIGAAWQMNEFVDIDIAGYGKLIDDFIVKAELGTSGIIFPVNLKNGFVAGGELKARLHDWHNFSGILAVSTCVSRGVTPSDGTSPIAAGLIIGEEGHNYSHPFSGEGTFPTEHNQLLTASLNLNYKISENFSANFGGRFDSGLPFDLVDANGVGLDETAARAELKKRGYFDAVINMLDISSEKPGSPDKSSAPHAIFDISANYNLKPVRLSIAVLNILDTQYLYKFESSFGGTHFGQPRMIALKLDVKL